MKTSIHFRQSLSRLIEEAQKAKKNRLRSCDGDTFGIDTDNRKYLLNESLDILRLLTIKDTPIFTAQGW